MNKIILVLGWLMFYTSSYACDVCGTALSSGSMGILPKYNKNFLALKYQFSNYSRTGMSNGLYYDIQEQYQFVELSGRLALGERWQIIGQVPLNFDQLQSSDTQNQFDWNDNHLQRKGIGDARMTLRYNIWRSQRQQQKNKPLQSDLWLSTGVKAPTGNYNEVHNDMNETLTFLNGTGSWDFFGQLTYSLRYKSFGWSVEGSYFLNTENPLGYTFGNRIGINQRLFYLLELKKSSILPYLGYSHERVKGTAYRGFIFEDTQGKATLLELGTQYYFKDFLITCAYYHPTSEQNKILNANVGQRFMLGVFLFL